MPEVMPQPVSVDKMAMQVFLKAIDLVGGPRGLVEHRRLTWLPSLMEASYAVVLREEARKTADEIASLLGISTTAVRNILSGSPEAVLERIRGEAPADERTRTHIAGSLAKLAYRQLRVAQAPSS